jgi:tetratricopeptide (TPR) repeat protein
MLRKIGFVGLVLLLTVPMCYGTIKRNPDWETDNILFMHDAWVVPNSVLANGNSGKAFIEYAQKDTAQRQAFLDSAIYHLEKAVTLHPKYVNGFLNLGLAYFQKKDLDKAEYYWSFARKYFPTHPFFRQSYDPALANALVERARREGQAGNVPKSLEYVTRALRYDSTNSETWYHYGGLNSSMGNVKEAYRGWNKCLQLNPNNTEARKYLNDLVQRMNAPQQPAMKPR